MQQRVIRKISFTATMAISCQFLGSVAYAQMNKSGNTFKKFSTKSRFNQGTKSNSDNFSDDDSNKSTFGARTPKQTEPADSKYVNLNLETAFGPEIITSFDFPDTDIMEVTRHMQKLTGINLILDKDVKGKVSITAPTPITVGDAWKAYLAALNMAGYTLVKSGAFYKIINARDVRYTPTKIYTGQYTPETESHIMKVMALKYVDAGEISRNFRPFMSRYGRIIDIKQTNTIIISDTGANIVRLEKLIQFIDVPGHEESLQIIPVKNSSAQEIAKLLDEILKSDSGGSARSSRSSRASSRTSRFSSSSGESSSNISKIIAEPRTNSIIAMANATGAQQLRDLIKKLDVEYNSTSSGKIHVHYLNFGNAEELAKTLSTIVTGAKSNNSSPANGRPGRSFVGSSDGSSLFNDEVKITADKNNNALVVTASPTDWLTLKSVIHKLDIPRDQVYVEGLIMETTISKVKGFGVEFMGAYGPGNAQRGGLVNQNGSLFNLLSGTPQNITGFFAGIGGPEKGAKEVEIGGQKLKVNSVNAIIKAIATHDTTNVLATPQILAMDNTEAEFEVGTTVPIKKESTTGSTVTSSFETQEAKLSLKITPQINKVTRFVTLKINQSIDDFLGELNTSGTGAATSTRSAITEVMIKDRETIAMGGLLRDRETVSFNKVPLLGDIPVLGWLFKNKTRKIDKVNLLFFLTPRILSPYDNVAAKNSLRALKNRTDNLKQVLDKDTKDPHAKKVDELTAQLELQRDKLGNPVELNEFQKSNQGPGIGNEETQVDIPNYKEIMEEVENNNEN